MSPKRRRSVKRKPSNDGSAAKKQKGYRRIIGDGRLEKYLDTLFLPDISTIIASYDVSREGHIAWRSGGDAKAPLATWPRPVLKDCKQIDNIVFSALALCEVFEPGVGGWSPFTMSLRGHVVLNLVILSGSDTVLSVDWPLSINAVRRLTDNEVKEPPGDKPSWYFFLTDRRPRNDDIPNEFKLTMQRVPASTVIRCLHPDKLAALKKEYTGPDRGMQCVCDGCCPVRAAADAARMKVDE